MGCVVVLRGKSVVTDVRRLKSVVFTSKVNDKLLCW